MALPATYDALRSWLVDVTLSPVAADLGWTAASAPVTAAVDVVELLLARTVAAEGATAKLLALAEWQIWERAAGALVNQIDLDKQGLKRSQVPEHVQERLHAARLAASAYPEGAGAVPGHQVGVATLRSTGPHGWADEWA